MKKRIAAVAAAALTVALAAFAGAALAGNGHGGGSHDPGRQNDGAQPRQARSGGDETQGVKPDATTKHDTYATAGSGYTKRYGNGQTAGRIAERHGAGPAAVLHRPGNSRPHKVAVCPGGHERDVHALAGGGSCGRAAPKHEVAHVEKPVVHVEKQATHVGRQVARRRPRPDTVTKTVAAAPAQPTRPAVREKVWICHATGSATNPYVLIHVSKSAEWAHARHHDGRDLVLGETLPSGSACPTAPATAAVRPVKPAPPPTRPCTRTKQVEVAVVAHDEHPDEVVRTEKTVTTSVPCVQSAVAPASHTATQAQAATTTVTTTTSRAAAAPAPTPAPVAATTTAPSTGAVAGARSTAPASAAPTPAPRSGVLGAQARLPRPASSSGLLGRLGTATLPFTGLPLLPFALGALALVFVGAGLTRTVRGR